MTHTESYVLLNIDDDDKELENTERPDSMLNDHDLLIKVSTTLDMVYSELRELRAGTAERLQMLEKEKVDKSDFESLSEKVSAVQRLCYIGLGIVLALDFAIVLYTSIHSSVK